MADTKKEGDSLYWVVEQECARLQGLVAIAHAKRGNHTVMMTPRKISEERADELRAVKVELASTRGNR